jgi:hypothetical protein
MNLPTLIEAETDTMVNTVAHWVDVVDAMLTSDAGHLLLRNHLRRMLREGVIETLKVVTAAEQGHQDADLALRELGAEMLDRGEMPNATLRSYLVKALVTAPVRYPPGRNIADTWVRDIGIAVMVAMVMAHWPHLKATRNRAAKRPSASTIVALALSKRGFSLTEWQVERIHGNHNRLAGRVSASIGGI